MLTGDERWRDDYPSRRCGPGQRGRSKASTSAGCKHARLCALVSDAAAPNGATIIRGKNVAAVSHPATGALGISR